MKRKLVWLAMSGWMVAALLVTSCAPAVVEEEEVVVPEEEVVAPEEEVVAPEEEVAPEEGAVMVKWTGTKDDGTVVERMLEKPKYGGNFMYARADQPLYFDDRGSGLGFSNWPSNPVNETLLTRDRTRGPLGTAEYSPRFKIYPLFNVEIGLLAESWELIGDDTLVFHIRQGVRWHDVPPLNGRPLTADDVVFSLRRQWGKGSYLGRAYRYLIDMTNLENSIYVSPEDDSTVVIECLPGKCGPVMLGGTTSFTHIVAPEAVGEDYYNKSYSDWEKIAGTGPFILKDYVGASSLTYERNPNYWRPDPFFPENKLPYVDSFKILIIPDLSTRMAGVRTGKLGMLYDLKAEDAKSLLKGNPELESTVYLGHAPNLHMRNDTPPFDDVRVRRALWLATNNQELVDLYYEGKAELFVFPVPPIAEHDSFYIPLEELPESVQELYGYNPDKAKQLLAEAGYPDGFKYEVICWKSEHVDILQIFQAYFAKIGVDLIIDVKESGVYSSIMGRDTHKQGNMFSGLYPIYTLTNLRKGGRNNDSMVDNPEVDKLYDAIQANYFDRAALDRLFVEPTETRPNWITYANEQAWYITTPAPQWYAVWQPWIKGYSGATSISYYNDYDWARYLWIDQELQKSLGR